MRALRRGFMLVLAALLLAPLSSAADNGKLVFLILGPPGSGKTTQAGNLSRKFRIPSYSMSTIFKKESGWVKDRYKKSLSLPIATGDTLGDEISNQLVEKYITGKKARNGFILDGYPRTLKQAEYFEQTLTRLGLPEPIVIHLSVPDQVARDRLAQRSQKQDTPEIIDQRMADHHAEAQFLTSHYKDRLRVVDGRPSQAQVWLEIQKAVPEPVQ